MYWESNPPLHMMVKWFLGIEGKKEVSQGASQNDNQPDIMQALMQFPQG